MKHFLFFLPLFSLLSTSLSAQLPSIQLNVGTEYRFIANDGPINNSTLPNQTAVFDPHRQLQGTSAGFQVLRRLPETRFFLSLSQFVKYDHHYYVMDANGVDNLRPGQVIDSKQAWTTDILLGFQVWHPAKQNFLKFGMDFGFMNRGSQYLNMARSEDNLQELDFTYDGILVFVGFGGEHFTVYAKSMWIGNGDYPGFEESRVIVPMLGVQYHLTSISK